MIITGGKLKKTPKRPRLNRVNKNELYTDILIADVK
jgi:hypothetical protein